MDEVVLSAGTHMTRNWPVLIEQWTRSTLRDPLQHVSRRHVREDPCYGYKGYFVSANWRRGPEMRCPNCSSRPRDRLLAKLLEVSGLNLAGKRILHFAPEWPLYRRLKDEAGDVGGDIIQRRNADAVVNITAIDSDDTSYDVLICNHVLEHVRNHLKAIRERHRVLREDGIAFFSRSTLRARRRGICRMACREKRAKRSAAGTTRGFTAVM
jgi:hypothetical protein